MQNDSACKAPFAKCSVCPLRDQPFVPPYYPEAIDFVAIGEAPGYDEVQQGRPFVGMSGKLLGEIVRLLGRDYSKVAATNTVLCRPPNNRTPTEEEVACCKERLDAELFPYLNRNWLVLGKEAKLALLGWDAPRGQWQGNILPAWHPAYVLRKPSAFADLQRDVQEVYGSKTGEIEIDITVPESFEEMTAWFSGQSLDEDPWGAFDIETAQTQWYDTLDKNADPILYLQISLDGNSAIVIPRRVLDDPRTPPYINEFAKKVSWYAQNGSFDAIFLWHQLGIDIPIHFDTMLAHYVLDENTRHGLKIVALELLGIPDWETDLLTYLNSRNDDYSKVPEDVMVQYAATDAVVTWRLGQLFTDMLVKEGLYTYPFKEVIMRLLPLTMGMTYIGQHIDVPHLLKWYDQAQSEKVALVARMEEIAGHTFNPNSPKQVAAVLWDERGLKPNKESKDYAKNNRSTSEDAIEHLHSFDPSNGVKVRDGDEFVDLLLEYRHIAKIVGSYMENLLEMRDVNDRVHPDVLIHGTEIGRIAMRDPAMMTIPRASDKWGRVIRSAITAAEGKVLVVVDFSQAELRVLGALSGDPYLLDAYNNDRDIHSEVATAMFGDNFTKEQRVMVKMFNFAYAYGGNEWSFARDAGLPIDIAKAFVHRYDQQMAVAKQWKQDTFKQLKAQGYVQTRFGRRRRFPLITDANVKEARKACVHFLVASTASDVTLLAARRLMDEGRTVVLTVHDSILLEVDEAEGMKAAQHAKRVMEEVATKWIPEVKWKADIELNKEGKIGVRWVEPPES